MLHAITIQHVGAHYTAMLQSWSKLLWIWDVALFVLGFLFLFSARRSYRALIMANCAALGWYMAMFFAHWSWLAAMVTALIGTILGVLLVPMMRIALFILGAIAGGTAGVALWHVFKQPPDYRWVPAIIGVIVLGIAGLYIFTASAVLICTLEGSIMVVIGITGFISHYGPVSIRNRFMTDIAKQPVNLLECTIGLACLGLLAQMTVFSSASKKQKPAEDNIN